MGNKMETTILRIYCGYIFDPGPRKDPYVLRPFNLLRDGILRTLASAKMSGAPATPSLQQYLL